MRIPGFGLNNSDERCSRLAGRIRSSLQRGGSMWYIGSPDSSLGVAVLRMRDAGRARIQTSSWEIRHTRRACVRLRTPSGSASRPVETLNPFPPIPPGRRFRTTCDGGGEAPPAHLRMQLARPAHPSAPTWC
jgi:hypothetical protein